MAWLPSKASLASMKDALSEATNRVSESVASFDIKDAAQSVKNSVVSAAGKTKETSITAYGFTKEKTVGAYVAVSDSVDWCNHGRSANRGPDRAGNRGYLY